jgi:predicted deacylase
MRETTITLPGFGPGTTHALSVLTFGDPDARPHVHVQGGLHADEGPGMLAARMLADRLAEAERAGRMVGCVTVVPSANPIGLGQFVLGDHAGRFDLYDGRNFNRDYPDLARDVAARVGSSLGDDAGANLRLIREALARTLEARSGRTPSDALRLALLRLAAGADIVLDLHCDGEAEVHLYTHPAALDRILPLAALTGCRAVLVAEVSGGNPFDEALTRFWTDLGRELPDHPVPHGCASCTLELRGRSDVSRALGARDAAALFDYLVHMGAVTGEVTLPPLPCDPAPLAGSEALTAPVPGLLSYAVAVGTAVSEGDVVAEITDLATGHVSPVRATTSGVFYARPATRIAEVGKRLGKIAGAVPFRDGLLLSP